MNDAARHREQQLRARPVPRVTIQAFCEDQETSTTLEAVAKDRRFSKAHVTVQMGGVPAAVSFYQQASSPNLIIVESVYDREPMLAGFDILYGRDFPVALFFPANDAADEEGGHSYETLMWFVAGKYPDGQVVPPPPWNGSIKSQSEFTFGQAMLPLDTDVADAPQNSIIGGATLWVLSGKSDEEYKGTAKFLNYILPPLVKNHLPDWEAIKREDKTREASTAR